MIYSSNFWSRDNNNGLPVSYNSSNQSGQGLLIDFTNAKIYAGSHNALGSSNAGFFLNESGLSIGSKFFVDASDGKMRIGEGAVNGVSSNTVHFWNIDTRPDTVDGVTTYESYIAYGGNRRYDADNPNPSTCAKVYIGTDGISIGTNFTVDKDGNLKIGGGSIGGDEVGGWWIYNDYLASNNYKTSGGTKGIKLDPKNDYISLGNSNAKIYSGNHDDFEDTADGFYLSNDGFSIGSTFSVDETGHLECTSAKIGDYEIGTDSAEGGGKALEHSLHAWKLRSAKIDDSSNPNLRYYTYLTKNKNFIVSNEASGGHSSTNDVTPNCSIGSYNYPWGGGYFDFLRVKHRNVIPEGIDVTVYHDPDPTQEPTIGIEWHEVTEGGQTLYYYQDQTISGIVLLTADTNSKNQIVDCYPKYGSIRESYNVRVEAHAAAKDKVRFFVEHIPSQDLQLVLVAEEFTPPEMNGAKLEATYDDETGTLTCTWNSPDDSGIFLEWQKDTLIVEKLNETTGVWEQVVEVESTTANEYNTTPLVIGGE